MRGGGIIKKALIIANTSKFMTLFLLNDIQALQNMGFEVHCFTDFHNPDYEELDKELAKLHVVMHDTDFHRSPYSLKHIQTYKILKHLMLKEKFDLIHCHTPTGGVVGRLASANLRKKGTKVIYTSHGFHFYKRAPLLNWLLYYPIELILAHFTDIIITINKEDFGRARRFSVKRAEYMPGIGLNYERYHNAAKNIDRNKKRKELHLPEDAFLVATVGEVNKNKNHITMIRAVAKSGCKEVEGVICGIGEEKDNLIREAKRLGVSDRIHFLGFRMDMEEVLACADVFMFPSKREGLGMAALEGMAAELPLLSSNIHGIRDYTKDGITGFTYDPEDDSGFARGIVTLLKQEKLRKEMGRYNSNYVKKYSEDNSKRVMERIYMSLV